MKRKNQDIVNFTLDLYSKLQQERGALEDIWQQVATFVRPQRSFDNKIDKKEVYDSTAIMAAEYLVSALWSLIANSSARWFYLKHSREKLNQDSMVKDWLKEVNNLMQENLKDVNSGFYHKSYEFYADLVCFGTGIFYLGENLAEKKILFKTGHLKDIYITNLYDEIDTVIQKISLNPQEAIEKFGIENVSKKIKEAAGKDFSQEFEFLHLVVPNRYFKDRGLLLKKMSYASYYIDVLEKKIIKKGGYYEFPYIIARWYTNANQTYGQSPAIGALADIKMLNAISKTSLIAVQKQVDPPVLAPNEESIQGIKTMPGGVIYGGIDSATGNQLLKPFSINADVSNANILQEQRRMMIKDAFYYSLLLFSHSKSATATEVISNNEQKLRILGAKISRIQSEFLYPLLKRQLMIMYRLGKLPPIPNQVDIKDIEIDFISLWNRYQKIQESVGVNNLNQSIHFMKEFIPDISEQINWQEMLKIVVLGNGLGENILKR